jgi:hypothetical protein
MNKIANIAAAALFTVFAIAASAGAEQKPAKKQVTTTVATAAEHDYKLEREGCCGPQE